MDRVVTRRRFLGGAAAVGSATLLPTMGSAQAKSDIQKAAARKVSDTANTSLTRASVARVKWKAEPFAMTEVRLLPGYWKDMMELNRSYLYSLPNERLAHNFRV